MGLNNKKKFNQILNVKIIKNSLTGNFFFMFYNSSLNKYNFKKIHKIYRKLESG